VHHLPAGPPLSTRLAGALARGAGRSGRAIRHRSGRLALGTLVSTAMAALVLAVPVVAGPGDSPSSDSTFVLGVDGRPLSSDAFAGVTSTATLSSDTGGSAAATSEPGTPAAPATAEPTTAGSLPAGTGTSAPAPAAAPESPLEPAPAPAPAPAETTAPAAAAAPETSTPAPVPAAAPVASAADGPEAEVLALVNAERAAAGCAAVTADDELAAMARAHSEDRRDRGFFGDVESDGQDPVDPAERAGLVPRAENIAAGQQDAAEVMAAWMDSPGHRANILDCDLTLLGTGVATGTGGPWWTQLFA
jgi:uncharacterized protein YkwD